MTLHKPDKIVIQSVDLYGETRAPHEASDVLHAEAIAARSRHYNWSFEAHAHAVLDQFFWITRSGGRAVIDGVTRGFGAHSVIFVPHCTVHGFNFTPGTQGWVITVPASLPMPRPAEARILAVTKADTQAALGQAFSAIATEFVQRLPARREALEAQAKLLGVALQRAGLPREAQARPSASQRLMRRFTALVEERFRSGDRVGEYAAALAVTPAHLSRVCRQMSGRSAEQLIHERLLLEARRSLAHSERRINEIASDLGFTTPVYFTRLFTAKTGESPTVFRAKAQAYLADLPQTEPV